MMPRNYEHEVSALRESITHAAKSLGIIRQDCFPDGANLILLIEDITRCAGKSVRLAEHLKTIETEAKLALRFHTLEVE